MGMEMGMSCDDVCGGGVMREILSMFATEGSAVLICLFVLLLLLLVIAVCPCYYHYFYYFYLILYFYCYVRCHCLCVCTIHQLIWVVICDARMSCHCWFCGFWVLWSLCVNHCPLSVCLFRLFLG